MIDKFIMTLVYAVGILIFGLWVDWIIREVIAKQDERIAKRAVRRAERKARREFRQDERRAMKRMVENEHDGRRKKEGLEEL